MSTAAVEESPPKTPDLTSAVLKQAVSRRRSRCWVETEHNHTNVISWIQKALPDWKLVSPSRSDPAPSAFPEENTCKAQEALQQTLGLQPPLPSSTLQDMIAGHCETCAVILSEHVVAAIKQRNNVGNALTSGYASLYNMLQQSSGCEEQVRILFEAEKRAATSGTSDRQLSMWQPVLGPSATQVWAAAATGKDPETVLCAGLKSAAVALQQTASSLTTADVATLPLYILNYIWDGDELMESDMDLKDAPETAQFSLHVVGLVLDGRDHKAYICDPNGTLLPGGSMEFVRLPVEELPTDIAHSTSNSKWDREDQEDRSRKRKRRADAIPTPPP